LKKLMMFAILFFSYGELSAADASSTVILAGRLIDGISATPQSNQVIVIRNGKITAVGPAGSIEIPSGANVIDLNAFTVLPGFIDCHTHLTSVPEIATIGESLSMSSAARAFRSAEYAKRTLLAGFTTVRDVGGNYVDVALRDAIEDGYATGPRMLVSGPPITSTGGHSDFNDVAPEYSRPTPWAIVADGVDEIRRAVRTNRKFGVDLIKIMASGGIGSANSNPAEAQYTVEELRAAVEEARMSGKRVVAHAHSTQGIKNAILAGVASIEHGSLLDAETIALMKSRGVYLVPDLYADEFIEQQGRTMNFPAEILAKNTALSRRFRESFRRAHAAGVKIAFGTDAGVYPHGDNAKQFALMEKLGMSPAEAIGSATTSAADLLGLSDTVGKIVTGYEADIIGVQGNPLSEINVLEDVRFVMKAGKVFKTPVESPTR